MILILRKPFQTFCHTDIEEVVTMYTFLIVKVVTSVYQLELILVNFICRSLIKE